MHSTRDKNSALGSQVGGREGDREQKCILYLQILFHPIMWEIGKIDIEKATSMLETKLLVTVNDKLSSTLMRR